jgi:Fe-S oxidoreductase
VKFICIHDILKNYIEEGRIKLDKSIHHELTTFHDPCNYGRKGERMFGQGYYEEPRWVTQQCVDNFVEMWPNRANNYCCGAGGGAWASPYVEERVLYGRVKAKQIKDTGAKLLIAPCHNCRDQIMKSLRKEYDFMDVEVKYLWELVADSLIIEPREAENKAEE